MLQDGRKKGLSETSLKNGLTVATLDSLSKYSNISIFVRAGSRYEDSAMNMGISHCLRSASCSTSQDSTRLRAMQLLSAFGGQLSVEGTRVNQILLLLRLGCI